MKKMYQVNHTIGTITMTKGFADKAGIVNTTEYQTLCQLKKDFPNYRILQKKVKVSKERDFHKDLTMENMAKYIRKFDEDNLATFQEVKEYHETKKAYYANVKAWFLSAYPYYRETERLLGIENSLEQPYSKDSLKSLEQAAADAATQTEGQDEEDAA